MSTETENVTADETTASEFLAQFESLEIPPNIDPKLLALWLEREREAIENSQGKQKKPKSKYGRKLNRLFAAYIGIVVLCLAIVLGFVQQKETMEILNFACQAFLVYTVIGFFVGCIAEYCVNDSVETLLREIIRRSDETAANVMESDVAAPVQES
jgi:hypothetical protein